MNKDKAIALYATLAFTLACSESSDTVASTGVTCGPGTMLQVATCVPTASDAGAVVVPDAGQLDVTTVSCGPGTILKDGVCVLPSPPDGPTFAGLATVTSTSTTAAKLTWTAATDVTTSADRLYYRVYVSPKAGTESYGSPQFSTLPGKTSFDVTGLDVGATYFFVVRAVNPAGVEDKNTIEKSVTTSTDDTPPQFAGLLFADFIAPATGTVGQAKLTWAGATEAPTAPSEIVYEVYDSTTPHGQNLGGAPKTTVTGAVTATVDNVDYAVSHYYVVLARDKSGNRNPNIIERKLVKVPNFTDHIMPILVGIPGVPNSAKCAIEGGCHLGPRAPSGLAMDTVENAYANLVGVNASTRYPVWTKAEMTAGTPTTITTDAGVLPMGNVTFTATLAEIQPPFGALYSETQAVRVIPGFPVVSFLYQKVTNTHSRSTSNDPSNAEMPNPATGSATLTTEERDRIRRWILGGALKSPP